MSNFISKGAVIALIESKCTDGCLGTEDTTLVDAYELIDEVSEMSTAYDVDKVVEQLEERKKYLLKEFVLVEKAEEVKEECEVIGNIFDNPELLGEAAEG